MERSERRKEGLGVVMVGSGREWFGILSEEGWRRETKAILGGEKESSRKFNPCSRRKRASALPWCWRNPNTHTCCFNECLVLRKWSVVTESYVPEVLSKKVSQAKLHFSDVTGKSTESRRRHRRNCWRFN